MIFLPDEKFENAAKLKVIGVGGGGGNAVNYMVNAGLTGVDFIAVNTDEKSLNRNLAPVRVQIGRELTKGLGAGTNPEIGRAAMEEDRDKIREVLEGADMVFITAGMGGGTGTGGAPIVAQIAKELGVLSVSIVTKPFEFEGHIRSRNAKKGIEELRKYTDTIILVPNQKLLSIVEEDTEVETAFGEADKVLYNATKGISDIITKDGYMQVDFADVRTTMTDMGEALIGLGGAKGDRTSDRAFMALEDAIGSPLLDDINIAGALGLIVNFTGGKDMTLREIDNVSRKIRETIGVDAQTNIVTGMVIDEDMQGEIRVTVVATGFNALSMEECRAERGSAAPKVVIPPVIREPKTEQTRLDFVDAPAPSNSEPAVWPPKRAPADEAMEKQMSAAPNPYSSWSQQTPQAVQVASAAAVTSDKDKTYYKDYNNTFSVPSYDHLASKAYGGSEDWETPSYLRRQQQ